jgi:DNA relaxase NicK
MAMEVWLDHSQTTATRTDLSGRGCRDLEILAAEKGLEFEWGLHLAWLLGRGAVIKRLDFAIDLYGPGLDMAYISRAIDRDMYVSRYDDKSINEIKGKKTGGWTIYLGSQESASYMRLYDKVAERLARADEKVGGKWIRLEWSTKAEVAVALGGLLARDGISAGIDAFNGYFRLLGRHGNVDTKWAGALRSASTRRLEVVKRGGTVEATEAWIERSVSKSLSALFQRRGPHGYAWLNSLIEGGASNQSAKHRQMAANPVKRIEDDVV